MLKESTFCLVPRGRRLATFRFLEAIRYGCIPVLLSNAWILPFSEVIDWSRSVIWGDERFLTQVIQRSTRRIYQALTAFINFYVLYSKIPSMLRQIPMRRIMKMQQYSLFFYNEYFSSIERIMLTSIEVNEKKNINWVKISVFADSFFSL